MPRAGVRVEGARELRRTLRRAGDELTEFKAAHEAASRIAVPASRGEAPTRSGRLASSVRGGVAAASLTIRAGGAAVPYAGPIHWGWRKRSIAANPFIVRAVDRRRVAMVAAYERGVDRILARIRGA